MTAKPLPAWRKEFLPLARPTLGEEEIQEVVETLRSGWLTTGPKVERFEGRFKEYLGIQEAVAVSSGSAGLHLALLAAGVGAGDEVITTSMSFAATANAIVLCGAKPIFADCDPDTLNIDLRGVEARITEKTKAIVPVHFAGQSCAMDELMEIARRRAVPLIEDAAHALGTEYKGRKIGALADMAVFSFHPIKTITTGEGGMVVTSNKEWAERMRLLRFHGISTSAWQRHAGGGSAQYSIQLPGFKYTMMDIQAAIGIHQMDKLDRFVERRAALAGLYCRAFKEIKGARPLGLVSYPQRHAWHIFVVQLELEKLTIDRDRFLDLLKERNIGSGIHFPALHLQPYYQEKWGYRSGDFPNAERASERIVSLPLFPTMSEQDVQDVMWAVGEILARHLR
ncbi:MAG: DegT/DnrJ/EryC1/StrS aminotransferase family protein [Deltaproteobacteria bacterium]|nr:DegT/DnrJ/EryC1/StrS aminotransferase family protein [Deltaproteobacteria bacterium]MBI3060652.1 DegT/DnrJ/EryC1/StrS aminotransferase family protein [Deltaproteobacteria bacterium]